MITSRYKKSEDRNETLNDKIDGLIACIDLGRNASAISFAYKLLSEINNKMMQSFSISPKQQERLQEALGRLVEQNADDVTVYQLQANLYYKCNNSYFALTLYEFMHRKFPNHWDSYFAHAILLQELGQMEKSQRVLSDIIDADNNLSETQRPTRKQINHAKLLFNFSEVKQKKSEQQLTFNLFSKTKKEKVREESEVQDLHESQSHGSC